MTAVIEEKHTEEHHRNPYFPPPRARGSYNHTWRLISQVVLWALGLSIIALWLKSGAGYDLFRSWSNAAGAIGSLLGMIAAYIFFVQLLLMARIPFFEHGLGRDRIVQIHRALGFAVFWVILAHVFFASIGNIIIPRFAPGHHPLVAFGRLMAAFHFTDLAILGTLLIFGAVILLSLKRIRSKMRYELWHVWHLAAYLGVLLVIPHQFRSGGVL